MVTASDGVVQRGGDMQQNSCRVGLNGFSVELDGRGLKSYTRVLRIIYEVPKSSESWSQGRYPDIWLMHELRDVYIWPGIKLEIRWLSRAWVHFLPPPHSAKTMKSSRHLTVWWMINEHAPKVGGLRWECNIAGESFFYFTYSVLVWGPVRGLWRAPRNLRGFKEGQVNLASPAQHDELTIPLWRKRKRKNVCRWRLRLE